MFARNRNRIDGEKDDRPSTLNTGRVERKVQRLFYGPVLGGKLSLRQPVRLVRWNKAKDGSLAPDRSCGHGLAHIPQNIVI